MLKRLKALEIKSVPEELVLTEEQLASLEKQKSMREAAGEIETHHPGFLGSQDGYYLSIMKGGAHLSANLHRYLFSYGFGETLY